MAEVRDEILAPLVAQGVRASVRRSAPAAAAAAACSTCCPGPDLESSTELQRAATARRRCKTIPGVVDADTTSTSASPSCRCASIAPKAADLGVQLADVADALRLLVGGDAVTTYNEGGEQYEVHVRAEAAGPRHARRPSAVCRCRRATRHRARSRTSRASTRGEAAVRHPPPGRQRQVTVTANLLPGTSQATVQSRMPEAAAELGARPDYQAGSRGQSRELNRTATAFLTAFALSFIFMYLVLAAQFESWLHPVTILLSLPLTLPFALLSLIIFRQSLNIFSALGLLVLFGVVKKNSILQIDHTNQLRARAGRARRDRPGEPGPAAADPDDDAGVRRRHGPARRLERRRLGHQPRDRLGGHRRTDAGARADAARHAGDLLALRRSRASAVW